MYKVYNIGEFEDIRDSYSGILVNELLKINEEYKEEFNDIRTLIPGDIFMDIIKLGKKINDIDDKNIDNKNNEILKLAKEWINNNYFPYKHNCKYEYDYLKKFSAEVKEIYLIFALVSFLEYLIKRRISNEDLEKLKYYVNKLEIHDIVTNDHTYSIFFEHLNLKDNAYEFLDIPNSNNIDNDDFVKKMKKIYIPTLRNIIIKYIIIKIKKNFSEIKTEPVLLIRYNNPIPEFHIYQTADCLMDIIYDSLLKYLITEKNNFNLGECIYCKRIFEKKKKHQIYCEECIGKNIPKIIRDARYNRSKKGKAYHQEYYKNKKATRQSN